MADLDMLASVLRSGAQGKADLAGLDEDFARANAMRDNKGPQANQYGTVSPMSVMANVINQSRGRKQARELAPQRAAARQSIADSSSAFPMYQAGIASKKAVQDQLNADNKAGALTKAAGLQAAAKKLEFERTSAISEERNRINREKPVNVAKDTTLVTPEGKPLFSGAKTPSKALAKLQEAKPTRDAAIKKTITFLRAFNSGAESGTTRAALSFIPGQFTDQAAFDQELGAFSERAARASLKAAGEIRPTDADVEGAKQSLFSIDKGEQVNKNLLTEYLKEQIAVENEARALSGEAPMPFPDVEGVAEGSDWYGTLFKGEKGGQASGEEAARAAKIAALTAEIAADEAKEKAAEGK